jgi:drug/metabolite transporter (DMT)-like permease
LSPEALRNDRTWLIAAAAAMWGLDGLLRKPLATDLAPATVVLWEHLIAVAVLLPALPAAVRAFARCRPSHKVAVALIGIGASAGATALFTEAFKISARSGDFVTPLILQKLQPIVAVALAAWLIGERLRPGFAVYALPAFAGAWLLTFPEPFTVRVQAAQAALLAVGAAVLWGAGTVLGRLVGDAVGPRDLTVLRYVWGLAAAWVIAHETNAPLAPGRHNVPGLALLALIPGVFALGLYYVALRRTAASRATFAELAFPATAALVGVAFLGTHLTGTQWLGLLVVASAITALGWRERSATPTVRTSRPRPSRDASHAPAAPVPQRLTASASSPRDERTMQ